MYAACFAAATLGSSGGFSGLPPTLGADGGGRVIALPFRIQFRQVPAQSTLRPSLPGFACQWSRNISACTAGSRSGRLALAHAICSGVGCQSAGRRLPRSGGAEGGASSFCFGTGKVSMGIGHCGFVGAACDSHAHRMRAACMADSLRLSYAAAQGLWIAQSWTVYDPSSPSRNRTSHSTETNAPESPAQSAASSRSSADRPLRSPLGRLLAVHRNRQTRDHPPAGPSLRSSFRVFGCAGRPVAILASAVIGGPLS